jgi:phosphomethylpyrimidine synthase
MNKPTNQAEFPTPTVTTGPLAGSKRVYTSPKAAPHLKVPHREIELHPTAMEPPVRVYDCSGPYTDPNQTIDVEKGLPRTRIDWVKARGGVEEYEGREPSPLDNGGATGKYLAREFPVRHRPLRGVGSAPITQYEFAKAGVITDEMIYAAERENLGRAQALHDAHIRHADGESFGAAVPEFVTPEFVRDEIAARPRHHPRQYQPPASSSP